MSIRRVVPIEQAEWSIAPPPAWVEDRAPFWEFEPPDEHAAVFLLLDQQHDVATQAVSVRSVRRLLTHAAVQALGQVEIEFDPAAHRLILHELAVWRREGEGAWVKRSTSRRREEFLLRQREQQLEQQMLNGRLSLVALLEDVRIGDAVELAWTLEPREPLPGLRFTAFYPFAWGAPVARASFSVRLDPAVPVHRRVHVPEGVAAPEERVAEDRVAWSVDAPAVWPPEPNAAAGSWPFPIAELSGWSSWSEVAEFFAELWGEALAEGAEAVAAEAERLRGAHAGPDLVRAAIRFVQEEVRYLAVDFGHGAGMLPNGAGAVLRRRFGDCKDKSVLLTALLRSLGFDACPVLVAPAWGTAIDRTLPSTAAFSHAIVRFDAEGTRHYVDATAIGQAGDLAHLVPARFVRGLEVRAGAAELVALPPPPPSELVVTETFDLDAKHGRGSVETLLEARGPMADDLRAVLVREGAPAFFKGRAEALQRHFPALVPGEGPPDVKDDRDANVIALRARHALPTWGPDGQKRPPVFAYGAHAIFLAVEQVGGPDRRRHPWALRHPLSARHRVVVRGPDVLQAKPERHRFDGPGFRYDCEVRSSRREMAFDFHWQTTDAEIPPEEWAEYKSARSRAFVRTGVNVGVGRRQSRWVNGAIGAFVTMVLFAAVGRMIDTGARGVARSSSTPQSERQMNDARDAMQRGDYAAAHTLLEAAEPRYGESFEFQKMRAEVALRAGRAEPAREAIEAARRLEPANVAVDVLDGLWHEDQGNLPAARKRLERAVALEPKDDRALYALARVAQQMGDGPAARTAWRRLLERNPSQPDALLNYSLNLWAAGERDRADAAIGDAVRAQPTPSPRLEAALSDYFAATGRAREAVAPARRAWELASDDPAFQMRYANVLLAAGDGVGALDQARRMAERFPSDPRALRTLATVAAIRGDQAAAERAFEKWLDLAPRDPHAIANYAYFLHRTGRSAEARSLLKQATLDFPGVGIAWLNYATVLTDLGELDEAARARKKADELMPAAQRATLLR